MPCGAENVHPVPLQGQGQDTARLCAVSDHADAVAAAHLCNLPIGQNLPVTLLAMVQTTALVLGRNSPCKRRMVSLSFSETSSRLYVTFRHGQAQR